MLPGRSALLFIATKAENDGDLECPGGGRSWERCNGTAGL